MRKLHTSAPEVLFIRFSSLGDVLLAEPAVRAMKEALPAARATFLTKRAFAPVLELNPAIDTIVSYGNDGGAQPPLRPFCRGLGPYDAVVDLHSSLRSRICSLAVRAGRKTVYRSESLLRRLWSMGLLRSRMREEGHHVVERYLDALVPLGVTGRVSPPKIYLAEEEREEARRLLGGRGVSDPGSTAVLVPGAKWREKRWPERSFAEAGAMLHRRYGLTPVIVGDESERETAGITAARLEGTGVVDISGTTGLRLLASVLSQARIVIANDSGPGHIAAAVGTPLVTIFGPTSEAFGFRPLGEKVTVVSRPLPCRPCSLHGARTCPRGSRECLEDLHPDEVFASAVELLEG